MTRLAVHPPVLPGLRRGSSTGHPNRRAWLAGMLLGLACAGSNSNDTAGASDTAHTGPDTQGDTEPGATGQGSDTDAVSAGSSNTSAVAESSGTGPSATTDANSTGQTWDCIPADTDPADCNAPLIPGASRTCTITVSGVPREFLLYAPPSFDPCSPAALVVDAHGTAETAVEQAGLEPFQDWPNGLGSGFRLVADREGFLVAQPQGVANVWNQADVAFIQEIPGFVEQVAMVDPTRVYMTGISNGGQLTYWTACADTDLFRGFASVSGYGTQLCNVSNPAPLIHFHSPDDLIIPISNGTAAFNMWVNAMHCQNGPTAAFEFGGMNSDPREVCLAQSGDTWSLTTCDSEAPVTTCERWDGCDGGVEAIFCTVAPDPINHVDTTGGHILYLNGTQLSLAAVAWDFFEANHTGGGN